MYADGWKLRLAPPFKHRNTLMIPVKNRQRQKGRQKQRTGIGWSWKSRNEGKMGKKQLY